MTEVTVKVETKPTELEPIECAEMIKDRNERHGVHQDFEKAFKHLQDLVDKDSEIKQEEIKVTVSCSTPIKKPQEPIVKMSVSDLLNDDLAISESEDEEEEAKVEKVTSPKPAKRC